MPKLSLKNYKKNTPVRLKRIGDSLLLLSATIGGYLNLFEEFEHKKYVIGAIVVTGVLGKFITELTKEETPANEN